MTMQLLGKLVIRGKLIAETGLHIGAERGGMMVGGLSDNPVIKDAHGKPYVPGSSLKGKLRALLERHTGKADTEHMVLVKRGTPPIRMHLCNDEECEVCTIFGRHDGKMYRARNESEEITISNTTPTRLYVRDCPLIEESIPSEIRKHLDFEWTEVKYENSIDRITSAANPRPTERVPAGAQFDVELIYNVLTQNDIERLRHVLIAMELLEHDYLGGQGSRGYGKVRFGDLTFVWNSASDYESGEVDPDAKAPLLKANSASEAVHSVDEIIAKIRESLSREG